MADLITIIFRNLNLIHEELFQPLKLGPTEFMHSFFYICRIRISINIIANIISF